MKTAERDGALIFWHYRAEDAARILEANARPGWILGLVALKGVRYADAGSAEAAAVLTERVAQAQPSWRGRFHILGSSFNETDTHLDDRFERFTAEVEGHPMNTPLPFRLLEDEALPQILIAAYLACLAVESDPAIAETVLGKLDWDLVSREWTARTGEAIFAPANGKSAREIASRLREYFQNTASNLNTRR